MPRGTKPLQRYTPLVAKTPLGNRTPMKASRPRPAVPAKNRAGVKVRAGEMCEAKLVGCLGRGTDVHHRITQKSGGRHGTARERHDRMSNTLLLCRVCHGWIGARPAEAYEMGLSLKEWQIPAMEPVLYRGEVKYLDDLGGVWDLDEVGA